MSSNFDDLEPISEIESEDDLYETVDADNKELKSDEKFDFGEIEEKKKEFLPSYYSRNRDAILEKFREERKRINQLQAEGIDIKNYSQSYYEKNRSAILEKSRKNYLERKKDLELFQKYAAERKQYYLANKERIKKKNKYKNVILNSFFSQKKLETI